jgi:hypothetical protein
MPRPTPSQLARTLAALLITASAAQGEISIMPDAELKELLKAGPPLMFDGPGSYQVPGLPLGQDALALITGCQPVELSYPEQKPTESAAFCLSMGTLLPDAPQPRP